MSDVTITLSNEGVPSPSSVQVSPGDTVTFHADGADAVVCIHPSTYFGDGRYEIPNGTTTDLTVQPGVNGSFEFIVKAGDLNADCKGDRDKSKSGGGGP